jgi:ABC-type lipoprotein export system ATPase subunit
MQSRKKNVLEVPLSCRHLRHFRDYVSTGGSVLLVTHNAKASDYATRAIKMKNGQLFEF